MAQRRTFSPDIVNSDAFFEMPQTSQLLYFHLGMASDDDGFVNPRRVMRTIGSTENDLGVIVAKRFVIPFENGVIVIKHWRINNRIRKDWYKPTVYTEQKMRLFLKENMAYTLDSSKGTPVSNTLPSSFGTEMLPNRSRSIDKYSIDSMDAIRIESESPPKKKVTPQMQEVFDLFVGVPARFVWKTRVHERESAKILHDTYGIEELGRRYKTTQKHKDDPLCPQVDSPSDFLEKMQKMERFLKTI